MAREFVAIRRGQCALCGAHAPPTGEHKIKASLIKSEFEGRPTIFVGVGGPKFAQSSKSKHFHFKAAALCGACNSTRTQMGDRAFDQLHSQLKNLRECGLSLTDDASRPNYQMQRDVEVDSFRYFAKLICCFLAEVGGPRSKSISSFAVGLSDRNPVFLRLTYDKDYEATLDATGSQGFARHGGLIFRFDNQKRWVQAIESSLCAGGIRYDFWVNLQLLSKLELHFGYRDLIQTALANIIGTQSSEGNL